jgi:hypothetical protein
MQDAGAHDMLRNSSDTSLADIAAEIRAVDRQSGWTRTLAIGELILKHFFGGSIKEWRTHRRDKEASLRRLALRSDCPLGRSALSEAVAVYVACREIPGGKIREELSPSHLAAALKVDPRRRIELLEQAIARKWSVRDLRLQVSALRKNAGERRGRPRSLPAEAALTQAKNAVRLLDQVEALLHDAVQVDPDLLRDLQGVLAKTEEKASSARARLAELSAGARVTLAPTLSKVRADWDERKRAAG